MDGRTWQEGVKPTPEQFADWYVSLPRAERIEHAETLLDAMDRADVCFVANHERRLEAAEAAVDRVRRRHPRGDEEPGPLAPGLWCPTCGRERANNGYGACPDRAALGGA